MCWGIPGQSQRQVFIRCFSPRCSFVWHFHWSCHATLTMSTFVNTFLNRLCLIRRQRVWSFKCITPWGFLIARYSSLPACKHLCHRIKAKKKYIEGIYVHFFFFFFLNYLAFIDIFVQRNDRKWSGREGNGIGNGPRTRVSWSATMCHEAIGYMHVLILIMLNMLTMRMVIRVSRDPKVSVISYERWSSLLYLCSSAEPEHISC